MFEGASRTGECPKGKNREPRPGGFLRQQKDRRGIPPPRFFKIETTERWFFILKNGLGAMPTAWHCVGIRSPERCASFAVGKGEHREGRPWSIFRQENDGRGIPPPRFFKIEIH